MPEADPFPPPEPPILPGENLYEIALTPGIIQDCFLIILGRPASEEDVASHLSARTVGDLRAILMRSDEFRLDKCPRWLQAPRPSASDIQAERTVLLHIPKTGGTSLFEHLRACFPPERVCPDRFDHLYLKSAGDLAFFRFFSGHYCLPSCDLIPGKKRIVTLLRHPADRLISLYYFLRSHSDAIIQLRDLFLHRLARRHGMADFFALEEVRMHPAINNAMVTILTQSTDYDNWELKARLDNPSSIQSSLETAQANLESLAAFGLMEEFEQSVTLIFKVLNLARPAQIKTENVLRKIAGQVHGIEQIELEPVNDEARAALAPLVEVDLKLYRFAEKLFQQRWAEFQYRQQTEPT